MNTSRKTKLHNSPENKRWVIITGASHGIGKALAFDFAASGFNLFFVSRDKSALEKVAAYCKQQFDTEARVYAADLSDSNSTDGLINALSDEFLTLPQFILCSGSVSGSL
jgi:short-subunit dehydrogenase